MGLRLGAQYPMATNRLDLAARSGPAIGLHYFRYLSEWFVLGLEVDALRFKKGASALVAGRDPRQRVGGQTLAALATGRVNLAFDRPWTIFVKGGAGVHRTKADVETLAASSSASHSGLAVLAAGGAEVFLNKNVTLAFETRFEGLRLDKNKFGFDSAEFLTYQLGVSYWFGVR